MKYTYSFNIYPLHIIVIALLLFPQYVYASESDIGKVKQNALIMMAKNNYLGAIPLLTSVLKRLPDDIATWTNRAKCYNQIGKRAEAIKDARHVITIIKNDRAQYPENSWKTLFFKAQAYAEMREYKTAISLLDKAIKLKPKYTPLQAIRDRMLRDQVK